MSEHQQLPLILDLGGRRPVETLTRALSRGALSFYLPEEAELPAIGTEIGFEVRISGSPAMGRARVERIVPVDEGSRREMVVELAITELQGHAAESIARATFRGRVEEFAAKHREGARILEAAGGTVARPTKPDTTPLRPREAHWVDTPAAAKPEERPAPPRRSGRDEEPKDPSRVRPTRVKRHHWENEDRFRLR